MANFPWNAMVSRTTGIAAQAVAAGANYLGSEIDNTANLDTHLDIQIGVTCGTAPTANKTVEIYILLALNGTDYEQGNADPVDPTRPADALFVARAVTTAQVVTITGLQIPPAKFKILVKSELDQTASITVLAYGYKMGYSA